MSRSNAFTIEVRLTGNKIVYALMEENAHGRPSRVGYIAPGTKLEHEGLLMASADDSMDVNPDVPLCEAMKPWLQFRGDPSGEVIGHSYLVHATSPRDLIAQLVLGEYTGDRGVIGPDFDIRGLRGFETGALR